MRLSPLMLPLLVSFLAAGCASTSTSSGGAASVTATDSTRFTKSGFLSDYNRLAARPDLGGMECWRDAKLDAKRYESILIARMVVSIKEKPEGAALVDPSDFKTLVDYFHAALEKALKDSKVPVVKSEGPGVLGIKVALTQLVPTEVSRSVTGTLIPYGFVAEAGSGVASGRPAGSTPYLGETAMEMQFVDAGTGAILAECRDAQLGRKYAADMESGTVGAAKTWATGYAGSFQAWTYAQNAFDKWSLLVAQRLAQLRGVPPSR